MTPTVLLLHGSASAGSQWRSLAAALSPSFRVHAPDLAGYGTAPWPPGPRPYTLEAEAAPLERWMAQEAAPVHIVAHSYGGAVALHLARTVPQWIASLAVYEPVAFHFLREGGAEDRRAWQEINGVAEIVRSAADTGPLALGAAAFVDYWNGAGAWAAMTPVAQEAVLRAVPKVAMEFEAVLQDGGSLDDLRTLRVPRLLMQGHSSPLPARRVAARLASVWGGAGLAVLAGAGHMGPVTHKEPFRDAVERHLRGCLAH
jgi:pimeloyl-ACP methyl ester carboxylesterase